MQDVQRNARSVSALCLCSVHVHGRLFALAAALWGRPTPSIWRTAHKYGWCVNPRMHPHNYACREIEAAGVAIVLGVY